MKHVMAIVVTVLLVSGCANPFQTAFNKRRAEDLREKRKAKAALHVEENAAAKRRRVEIMNEANEWGAYKKEMHSKKWEWLDNHPECAKHDNQQRSARTVTCAPGSTAVENCILVSRGGVRRPTDWRRLKAEHVECEDLPVTMSRREWKKSK